jgi:hypothetical protein
MPSRKQRRRREKSMRHEYEYVYVDDEGREVEVDEDEFEEPPAKADAVAKPRSGIKPGTPAAKEQARAQRQPATRGSARVVQPPSWRRTGKRALIFAPLMFIVVSFLNRDLSLTAHVVQTLFLLAFFLPFSYVMDTIMYRTYKRRTGGDGTDTKPPARRGGR